MTTTLSRETPPLTMIDLTIFFRQKLKRDLNSSLKKKTNAAQKNMFQKKKKHKVSAEGPEKHRVLVLQEERSLEF